MAPEPVSYLTLARTAHASIEVKRSRFLATLEPVADEAAARAVVERMRREHWDARHHCSAFVLGADGSVQRSSDDGEPAGTAGAPMLEVLRGAGVSDTVAVVTRWFGGVLLGAGGLVRAYGDAVRAGLEEAGTLRRTLLREQLLVLDHADAGRVGVGAAGARRRRAVGRLRRAGPAPGRRARRRGGGADRHRRRADRRRGHPGPRRRALGALTG